MSAEQEYETILRDAHQSLILTRMTTEQMLPIVGKMDKVGHHSSKDAQLGEAFERISLRSYEVRQENLSFTATDLKNTK